MYPCRAEVLACHPLSPAGDLSGGLDITVFSYDGDLDVGVVACREMVPDVWNLIGCLGDALDELRAEAPGPRKPG